MAEDIQPVTGSGAQSAARFCNIPTGKSSLLDAHHGWIDTVAAPLVRSLANPWIDLLGYASKLGKASDNQKLSQARCEEVKKQIQRHRADLSFPQQWGRGEAESTGDDDDDDGYWRAVDVYIYGSKPIEPPKPIPPPGPPGANRFRIRVFRASGASIILAQGDAVVFHIVDDINGACGFYYYLGGGIAIGIKQITTPPGSISKAGDFVEFKTTRPVWLESFAGKASYFQDPGVSLGDISIGKVHLAFNSPKLRALSGTNMTVVLPPVITLGTGSGFGAGLGSASTGTLSKPVKFKTGECCRAPGGVCSRLS